VLSSGTGLIPALHALDKSSELVDHWSGECLGVQGLKQGIHSSLCVIRHPLLLRWGCLFHPSNLAAQELINWLIRIRYV